MQGGTFGSFCFVAFLLSLGETLNIEELRTGLQEDEIEANAEEYMLNSKELDDTDERANFGSLSGFNKKIYQTYPYGSYIPAQSSPYNLLGYSQGYGLGSSYGEGNGFSQAQSLDSTFGLNYASAEADANAQALADLSFYGSPYNTGNYGAGSSLTHAQAEAQANAISLGTSNFGSYVVSPGSSLNLAENGHSFSSGLVTNYASSDAVSQVIASGSGGYKNYGQDILSLAPAQGNSQSQAFSSGFGAGFTSAEINSQSLAPGSSGFSSDINSLGLSNYGSGLSSAEVNSLLSTSSFGSESNFAGTAGIQAQISGGGFNSFNFDQGSNGENAIKLPSAFVGANSRLIPPQEYIMPNIIPGGENIKICTKEGEFHNVWSIGYECLICACVSQHGYLSPVCVTCDVCFTPISFPSLPIPVPPPIASPIPSDLPSFIPSQIPPQIPSPSPPSIPSPEPQMSCDPLPTNTPFQNPLNPCQICICQYSFGFKNDVSITCEENPSCVLSSDLITIPDVSEAHVPELLPLCEKFPPNVEFPHPVDICKSCECLVSYNDLVPQHKIVCHPKPGCEPPLPLPSSVSSTISPINTDLLPWPPLQKPLPPGPLPGPPPHKSCEPYPPNQPFQHPWDDCQICVCNEIYSIGIVNIEVNCFTNPACCASGYQPALPQIIHEPFPVPVKEPVPVGVVVDRPVPVPQLIPVPKPVPVPQPVPQPYPVLSKPVVISKPQPYPVPVREPVPVLVPQPVPHAVPIPHPVPVPQPVSLVIQPTKYLDISCKAREIGEEFMYNSCRICTCQAFGNLVVPICRRPNRPECVIMPAAVPLGNIVYIEPRCRYHKPLQPFTSDCQSCKCQSIFTYVMAQCIPIPGCGQPYYGGSATLAEAGASANSQLASASFGQTYGFGNSQSAAASSAYSGSSVYGGYPYVSGFSGSFGDESSTNVQSGTSLYNLSPYSNSYQYNQATTNEMEGLTGFYTGLYPKPYGQIISVHQPGGLLGQSQSLSEAIAQSSISSQGLTQGYGFLGGRPVIKSGDVEAEELEEIQ